MEKIRFEYSHFIFNEDEPDDSVIVQREATIRPVNLSHEPYVAILNNGENSFHLIFGKQVNGHFLCIPNCFIGCELASYDDIRWNEESLTEATEFSHKINYNDVSAICYALKALAPHLS